MSIKSKQECNKYGVNKVESDWGHKINNFCKRFEIPILLIVKIKDDKLCIDICNSESQHLFYKNKCINFSMRLRNIKSGSDIIAYIKKYFLRQSMKHHWKHSYVDFSVPLISSVGQLYGFLCVATLKETDDLDNKLYSLAKDLSFDLVHTYYSDMTILPIHDKCDYIQDHKISVNNHTYSDELIVVSDLSGNILSYNENAFSFLGYKICDIENESVNKFIHPDYQIEFKKAMNILHKEKFCKFSTSIIDINQKSLLVDVVSQQVKNKNNTINVHIVKNRTLEIELAKALQRNERLLNTNKKILDTGYWIWEIGTNHIHVSEAGRRMLDLEYRRKMIPIHELKKKIRESDYYKVKEALKNTLITKKSQFAEFTIINKDLGNILVQCRSEVIKNTNGDVIQLVITMQDITKQREIENSVIGYRNQSINFFESICDGFFFYTHSKDDIFTYLSPSSEQVLGKPVSEMIGGNWREVINWVDCEIAIQKHDKHNNNFSEIMEYIHPDGSKRALLCSSITIRDCDGDALFHQGFAQEITKQKLLENELVKAKEAAEQASNEKSRILANLNHEMRTPMNAISGIIHLLNDTNLSYQQQQYLEKLNTASNWLNDIINNTLDFSKIEARKINLEKVEFSIRSSVDKAVELFEQRVGEKDLIIKIDVADDVPNFVIGDPVRTMQIINNFISNAIKFTEYGLVILNISNVSKSDNNITLKFTVKDTGIGIEHNKLERIFQPFTQADDSTTREYGGSGLGLAICKQLAELMGGEIWVKSTVNVGSEFNVKLPFLSSKKEISVNNYDVFSQESAEILVVGNKDLGEKINRAIQGLKLKTSLLDPLCDGFDLLKNINNNDYVLFIIDLSDKSAIVSKLFDFIVKSGILNSPTILLANDEVDFISKNLIDKHDKVRILSKPINTQLIVKNILKLTDTAMDDPNLIRKQIGNIKRVADQQKILVVEDVKLNQMVVEELLKKCNLSVDLADNGLEAIKLVKKNSYSLILMDIEMPLMDGYSTAKEIINIPSKDDNIIPIVAMTAHSLSDSEIVNSETGFDDYILKPIKPEIFYAVINKWLTNDSINPSQQSLKPTETWFEKLKENPLFDLTEVMEVIGENYKLYRNLLVYFLNYLQEAQDKMLNDLYYRKDENVKLRIHDLKGISGTIGAFKLTEQCIMIENCLKNGTSELINETAGLCIYLKKYIKELKNLFMSNDQNVIIV